MSEPAQETGMEEEFIPKEPGWYWRRSRAGGDWTPVHLSTTEGLGDAEWAAMHNPDEFSNFLGYVAFNVRLECTREVSDALQKAKVAELKVPGSGWKVTIAGLAQVVAGWSKHLVAATESEG